MTGPVLVTGSGAPVTVVAHGLGASTAETRPLVGGVPGTRVFPAARAHGDGPPVDGPLSYDLLGRDLERVADAHGATQALGVSMGAGALLSLLARRPDRFSRVVLLLPAASDRPRTDDAVARLQALATALDAHDADGVAACVAQELPQDLHDVPGVRQYLAARTRFLLDSSGVAAAVRDLPASSPVPDRAVLGAVTAEVLLLAQEGDPLHPASVARDLAAVLPRARLVVFDRPGAVVRERLRVRALVGELLGQ
ncbi:MAG: alpha/beta hydrolase [Frankiales bacterium]|nr:alpha/beta hydrolase [Frankiales bacterium]